MASGEEPGVGEDAHPRAERRVEPPPAPIWAAPPEAASPVQACSRGASPDRAPGLGDPRTSYGQRSPSLRRPRLPTPSTLPFAGDFSQWFQCAGCGRTSSPCWPPGPTPLRGPSPARPPASASPAGGATSGNLRGGLIKGREPLHQSSIPTSSRPRRAGEGTSRGD